MHVGLCGFRNTTNSDLTPSRIDRIETTSPPLGYALLFASRPATMPELLLKIPVWVVPLLFSVILHEIAHGWVAYRCGDPTAARMGRLTLNPLPHIDPIGTVALPLLLIALHSPFVFGWARPVPVNFANLRSPRRDMIAVALAGPATNLLLAFLCVVVLHFTGMVAPNAPGLSGALLYPIGEMAKVGLILNVVLAVFNMLPILPLDGGRVLFGLLPPRPALAMHRMERYGLVIVMVLLASNVLDRVIGPVVLFVVRALAWFI